MIGPAGAAVAGNVAALKAEVARVARGLGRNPDDVRIVAVAKLRPAAAVVAAMAAGLTEIGENRVQEAEAKIAAVSPRPVWHLVGHLQTNKAKSAARLFDWVQSIDSERVVHTLAEGARRAERRLSVLIQVNTTHETQKSGCDPGDLEAVIEAVSREPELQLRGLMTIGPVSQEEDETRRAFARALELRDAWRRRLPHGAMDVLSMGMSDDWPLALEYGSNLIRVGTALFGPRPLEEH